MGWLTVLHSSFSVTYENVGVEASWDSRLPNVGSYTEPDGAQILSVAAKSKQRKPLPHRHCLVLTEYWLLSEGETSPSRGRRGGPLWGTDEPTTQMRDRKYSESVSHRPGCRVGLPCKHRKEPLEYQLCDNYAPAWFTCNTTAQPLHPAEGILSLQSS